MYPDYKFSPRKRTTKPRAYRKRASHEFSARDHDNKQSLYALYQSKPLAMQQDNRHSITYLVDQKGDRASPAADQPIVVRSSPIHTTPYDTQLLCPPYYASSPASTVYPSVLSQSGSPVNSYDLNVSMTTETTQKEAYNSYLDHNTAMLYLASSTPFFFQHSISSLCPYQSFRKHKLL
ncbi:hypothetical protein EDC96DRAFT_494470 [Choanephora cucurbitarum]|nr:hypothetical protein EDC96DRAFT_494470 [Choanephora cucurbitarum]